MKNHISKNLVSLAAIVSSATLGLGLANAAYAAPNAAPSRPPKMVAAPAPIVVRSPISLSMQQLDQHITQLPQLAGAQNGDIVILNDDGTVTDQIWQGTYVFHPAGSVIQPGPMYARWKDGIVAITPTPANTLNVLPGTLDASFVEQVYDANHIPIAQHQTIRTLINDGSDHSVLRIPDNAWLFRVDSNGQLIALVDVFAFQSGSQPILDLRNPDGSLPPALGSQPVPVASGYSPAT